MAQTYKEISVIARKRRDDLLAAFFPIPDIVEETLPQDLRSYPKTSGLLSPEELDIIDTDSETLLQKIRDRKLTSVDVTKAFCKATVIAQKLTNCVTEVLFNEGLERARYLDEYIERTGSVIGPLHGLPVSLKDSFITPPHPSSIGMAVHANAPTEKDAVLVSMLRNLGAVLYVKTNIPTAMMMAETTNRIWGETRNPVHKELTPGGSSGGEGALVAMKASPLGIGTDIAGSIRIPSAFCQLYGLKPSFGRFSTAGGKPSIAGQDFIYAICGPMCPSIGAVKLFCESVLSKTAAPWNLDPKIIPMPWRRDVIQPKGRKLRFGILGPSDGTITCHPPVERALKTVANALKAAGHDVITWEPIDHKEIVDLLNESFDELGSDAIIPVLEEYKEPLFGSMERAFSACKNRTSKFDPAKLRQMIVKRNQLQAAYLERWMATKTDTDGPMDAIIAPVAPTGAPRLGQGETVDYVGFTAFANLLDYSACTFPVTYADKSIDIPRGDGWVPLNPKDEMIQKDYVPEFYHGGPVSLQLVGKRLEEEKVVEMVEVVADVLKYEVAQYN
ncbi:amidase [Blastomyces gilchristii SLH14081]|uniref:amidase n=1 Tax=Blastomyces gilchristii (strain SLH14081) TaxID=559298 RepID=A0A179UWY5_BLAGS|nr:amidase [Blastomyces gilchristii SLH14081]EQL34858.1 hypothetical protein BDFG_03303 [Blastomyces dermatitidis ATCC 26199]OAT12615.1 amidase [Blastomyces gilchristii SLH14081]